MTLEGFLALSDEHNDQDPEVKAKEEPIDYAGILKKSSAFVVMPNKPMTLAEMGIVPVQPKENGETGEPTEPEPTVQPVEAELTGVATPDADQKIVEREKRLLAESKDAKRKKRASGSHTSRPRYKNGGSH
jgi:hypothetical protein